MWSNLGADKVLRHGLFIKILLTKPLFFHLHLAWFVMWIWSSVVQVRDVPGNKKSPASGQNIKKTLAKVVSGKGLTECSGLWAWTQVHSSSRVSWFIVLVGTAGGGKVFKHAIKLLLSLRGQQRSLHLLWTKVGCQSLPLVLTRTCNGITWIDYFRQS